MHVKYNIEATERVQGFIKMLPRLNNYTYMYTVVKVRPRYPELRRLRSDLIWCYKITFGCINVTRTEFLMRRSTSSTRGSAIDPLNCTNNIPVALLVLHSSLNV